MKEMLLKNQAYFFIAVLAVLVLPAHFFSFLCPFVLGEAGCAVTYLPPDKGLLSVFIVGSVIGPLIETAVFQLLPVTCYNRFIPKKSLQTKQLLIGGSGLAFGATHHYNLLTVIDATIAGILFCIVFFYYQERGRSGFFYTFLLHALFNTYAFVLDDVLHLGK